MMFRPGRGHRTAEQETIRSAARLLVLTRQMRLALERTSLPAERSEVLSAGVVQLRDSVNNHLRNRWASVSPATLCILERVAARLSDLEQFTTISRDSFHHLRLVRAELLGLSGRSAEALRELERHAVFFSVQSNELRTELASRYFDLCTANGRFADGTRVLLDLVSRSRRRWLRMSELNRQFATILRHRAAVRAMGMVRTARALGLWNWFAIRIRPRRLRQFANYAFVTGPLSRIWLRERARSNRSAGPRAIRAMGGIGDLLTMTPGLRALAIKSGRKVQLVIPARFAPLFECNGHVEVRRLEEQGGDRLLGGGVIDLTDCPAARRESATAPNVLENRIEIFSAAMGVSRNEVARHGWRPFYEPAVDEQEAAAAWLRERGLSAGGFIAIQAEPADAYKCYRQMPEVARQLAQVHPVVVLHDSPLPGYDGPGVNCAFGLPLGVALAIACESASVVAADSAFVHLSGARQLPCLAIFGPTDGSLATRFYPNVRVLDQGSSFACMPCWRNETSPCSVTGGMRSACLDTLSVEAVVQAARAMIAGSQRRAVRPEHRPTPASKVPSFANSSASN